MKLILVESPTKSKTLKGFLGKEYEIRATMGHIRDLPKSRLGIDIEKNFEPQYIVPIRAKKLVNQLAKEAEKSDSVILAVDEDREGEAIAWHLTQALGLLPDAKQRMDANTTNKKIKNSQHSNVFVDLHRVQRIVFHEITKSAIEEALKNPRSINMNLVDAQQARRVLDRLVGYKLSPFLWAKVMRRLSAGRVQSVALRLIVEREAEIKNFKPEEYWSISAILRKLRETDAKLKRETDAKNEFEALLYKINGEAIPKLGIKTREEVQKIVEELKKCDYVVSKIEKKELRRNPLPPFTTSTMQQEASRRLRLTAKQTMRLAQGLYERGFITYMRTDSVNLSRESVFAAKVWIEKNLGLSYAKDAPRFFKIKSRLAQEAHEAIRPTSPTLIPEKFSAEGGSASGGKSKFAPEKKLYELIWRRFIASQLPQAIFYSTTIEIEASILGTSDVPTCDVPNIESENRRTSQVANLSSTSSDFPKLNNYTLRATGSIMKFDGYLKIWPTQFEEKKLPVLKEGEELKLKEVIPSQHFTEPAARYNEASLIKTLEEYGIGRPSTYAPIISVIQERNYVFKNEDRRFEPTEVGAVVNKILVEHFPEVVDIQFTARMEEKLDEIAEGKEKWQSVIKGFYGPFSQNLEKKYEEVEKQKPIEEETGEACEKCGKPMIIRYGRFGKFIACPGFPECKNAKPLRVPVMDGNGEKMRCSKCGEGEIVRRRTKRGRFFYGCSRYPECDYASWQNPNGRNKSKQPLSGNAH